MWEYNHTKSNELYHYGILGMKWGIRRSQAQLNAAGATKGGGEKAPEKLKGEIARIHAVNALPDAELKARVARLQMEENYLALMDKMGERGVSKVRKMLDEAATGVGKKILEKIGDKLVTRIFEGSSKKGSKDNGNKDNGNKDKASSNKEPKSDSKSESTNSNGASRMSRADTRLYGKSGSYRISRADTRLYGKSGSYASKQQERQEKDRQKRDKNQVKWLT